MTQTSEMEKVVEREMKNEIPQGKSKISGD
jgi:hypothetical protein